MRRTTLLAVCGLLALHHAAPARTFHVASGGDGDGSAPGTPMSLSALKDSPGLGAGGGNMSAGSRKALGSTSQKAGGLDID